MKTISQVACDAVMLHAFAQGVNELHDNLKVEVSPASNAMPALLDSLIQPAPKPGWAQDSFIFITRR